MIKKNILMLTILLLTLNFSVNAENKMNSTTGIVQKIDLEGNVLVINNVEYQIKMGKTILTAAGQSIGFENLEKGSLINFILENNVIIKIELPNSIDIQS